MVLCEDISMSGLFMASYKIIQDYHNSQLGEVDIFNTVLQMRDSGLGFVTSQEQFKFVLKCLHDEAVRTERAAALYAAYSEYVVSGLIFTLLIFLLVMMGVSNCDWKCTR